MNRPNIKRLTWTSRWSFLIAAFGASIGLGNTWKFPYEMGQNGGAPFVLAYLICLCLVVFPVLIAEVMIGRYGRRSPVHGITRIAKLNYASSLWQSIGWLSMLVGLLVFSFYSIVASWVLFYIMKSLTGSFVGVPAEIVQHEFGALLANSDQLILWYTIFVLMVIMVLTQGLVKGIERALKLLMPCLVGLIIWLFLYAREIGDFEQAQSFMFNFDYRKITTEIFIRALAQAFFTVGIGVGGIMVYGSYLRTHRSLLTLTSLLLIFDTIIALLMGLLIFSVVFAFGMQVDSGVGLIFQTLPVAFSQMSNSVLWSSLFFILLLIAALTSGFSLLEPSMAWMVNQFNISRKFSAWIIGCIAWLLGLLSVYAFSDLRFSFYYFGQEQQYGLFDFFNLLTANILIPLTALLISVFAGWVISRQHSQQALAIKFNIGYKVWHFFIKYVTPTVIFLTLLIVFFYQN